MWVQSMVVGTLATAVVLWRQRSRRSVSLGAMGSATTETGAPRSVRGPRVFFWIAGSYLALVSTFRFVQLLAGAPAATEIGSRPADYALSITTILAGAAVLIGALVATKRPGLAGKLAIAGGVLFFGRTLADAAFVWAWEPSSANLIGARTGELVASALFVILSAALARTGHRLLTWHPVAGSRNQGPNSFNSR
jgi:hypothetical protein